jgi:polyhydroxyalkanoate synthesis regulator protein
LASPVDFFQQAVRANMAVMAEAARAFTSVVAAPKGRSYPKQNSKSDPTKELSDFQAQMAAMQARLDKLEGGDS